MYRNEHRQARLGEALKRAAGLRASPVSAGLGFCYWTVRYGRITTTVRPNAYLRRVNLPPHLTSRKFFQSCGSTRRQSVRIFRNRQLAHFLPQGIPPEKVGCLALPRDDTTQYSSSFLAACRLFQIINSFTATNFLARAGTRGHC